MSISWSDLPGGFWPGLVTHVETHWLSQYSSIWESVVHYPVMSETYNPTFEELVSELQQIAPQAVEIAALRVTNRKLEEALLTEGDESVE